MNARKVQKWIRKNAPEYQLVRRDFVVTLQRQKVRSEIIERAARAFVRAKAVDRSRAFEALAEALEIAVPRATDKLDQLGDVE
jgi:hypothetical protein